MLHTVEASSQWGSVYKRLALYIIKNEASTCIALYKEG